MLQQNGNYETNFPLNSHEPVPFETDLFVGHTLIVIRPNNNNNSSSSSTTTTQDNVAQLDPYWNERIFAHKSRRLIIQLQGKFKRQPRGMVYAGAQVSNPLQLGLVTRGLASILLRFIETFNPNVHYSYGEGEEQAAAAGGGRGGGGNDKSNNNNNHHKTTTTKSERAHIVVPAYTFFERVIATPPGETPPSLGDLNDVRWKESPAAVQARKKGTQGEAGHWNTTDTYSFSYYSMYIDLPTWSLVKLPVSGNIALQTFWGQSLLNICMYEVDEATGKDKGKHWESLKTYAFSLQVRKKKETFERARKTK
jgi:hypothetical protein